MNLTIINSINDNIYANNLHIQDIQPSKILYIIRQITSLTKQVYTGLTSKQIVNNIIYNAYNSYIDKYSDAFYKDNTPVTITVVIKWYITETDGIDKQKSSILGLESLLHSIDSTNPFNDILTKLTKEHDHDIQICPIDYDLKNIPISLFHKVHRNFIKVGTYIYRDTIRGSYITILYDKTNKLLYFDNTTQYIDDFNE